MLTGAVLGQQIGIGTTVNLAALAAAASAATALLIPRHSPADELTADEPS